MSGWFDTQHEFNMGARYLHRHMETQRQRHTIEADGFRTTWYVDRLWELSAPLVSRPIQVDTVAGIDLNVWFWDGHEPTIRNVASRVERILAADLECPIILNTDGTIMDGAHRLARALIEGRTHILAKQFLESPAPDEREALRSADEQHDQGEGDHPS
jgi:hypothetical protein